MQTDHVTVPASVLLSRDLAPSAKLVWMLLNCGSPTTREFTSDITPAVLDARSGLTRHTVLRALAKLKGMGGPSADSANEPITFTGHASIPTDLLVDRQLGPRDKVMYGIIQLTGDLPRSAGEFTYVDISTFTGLSRNTIKQALRALQATGWIETSQRNRLCPVQFSLVNPAVERRQHALSAVSRRLEKSSFHGESIMREYLSAMVDSDEFDDNASPGYLVNPYTGAEMQFDRYYPAGVAIEFNGPQHYGPTSRFPSEMDARKQEARDYIKMGICITRGIKLLVLHPHDLSLNTLRQRLHGLLPLRTLDSNDPVIRYLEKVSRVYRRQAQSHIRSSKAK